MSDALTVRTASRSDLELRASLRAARLERLGDRAARIYTVLVFGFLFLPILIVVIYSFNAGRHVTDLKGSRPSGTPPPGRTGSSDALAIA